MGSGAPITVFAVEDRAAQLTWPWLAAADLTVEVGPATVELGAPPPAVLHRRGRRDRRLGRGPYGPGAVEIGGLEPATDYDITVRGPGTARRPVGRLRTLPSPPGRLTARFATINDLHIGERAFGGLETIVDRTPLPDGWRPYPERAARAAIDAAAAWGAERLVVKGDLTRDSEPVEFREVARLLNDAPMTVDVILGNHDVRHLIDGPGILAEQGIEVSAEPRVVDLPAARLILAHSPLPAERRGRLGVRQMDDIVRLSAEAAPTAVIVALHHAPQQHPVATYYPPGLYPEESRHLLARLREANPSCVVLAGHTHRTRTVVVDGVPVVEVGSTKDYPGQWAGYAVHEGGLLQVARRIAAPEVLAWTEATGRALNGLWGRWAPGSLADRCWTRAW